MTIVLTGAHKGGDHTLAHDLNFQSEKYEATHQVVCLRYFPRSYSWTGADHLRRSLGTRSPTSWRCSSSLEATQMVSAARPMPRKRRFGGTRR
jgi:hypothetical protein